MKLVSACLMGCKCRYDKNSTDLPVLEQVFEKGTLIPVCPEQFGGLSTPRNPAEIIGGDGFDVLDGRAKVIDNQGHDVTQAFLDGAYEALRIARMLGAAEAVLKERSPSCGSKFIYDGSFSGEIKSGIGVTAALLIRNGIIVNSDESYRNV